MSHFLLIFDRMKQRSLRIEEIQDADEAMTRLRDAEQHLHENEGAVLLIAEDEDDLRQTHAHYFTSLDDLLAAR